MERFTCYQVLVTTDWLSFKIYCSYASGNYRCVAIEPVIGTPPSDLFIFMINRSFSSLHEVKVAAITLLNHIAVHDAPARTGRDESRRAWLC